MRVVFLDVDGVLTVQKQHDVRSFSKIHASLLVRLARAVHQVKASIVVSSSWRLDAELLAALRKEWEQVVGRPMPFLGCTRCLSVSSGFVANETIAVDENIAVQKRSQEVLQWVASFQETCSSCMRLCWVAIDDLDLAETLHGCAQDADAKLFIKTDAFRGFSRANAQELYEFFQSQSPPDEGAGAFEFFLGNDERVDSLLEVHEQDQASGSARILHVDGNDTNEPDGTESSSLDAATAKSIFMRCGASTEQADSLVSDEENALVLLELLNIVGMLETSRRCFAPDEKYRNKRTFDLILMVTTRFRGKNHAMLRKRLAEFVCRQEIVSLGSLQAYASVVACQGPHAAAEVFDALEELEQFVDI